MTLDSATGRLAFEGSLTIRTAEAVCAQLRDAITQHGSLSIDCSAVTEVDLSFIQLLVAARGSVRAQHGSITLESHPEGPLLDALTRGGFRPTTQDGNGQATEFWFEGATA